MRLVCLLLIALLAAGRASAADEKKKPTGAKGLDPAAALAGDEIRVRSDRQGGAKGAYEFRGFVDLQAGDLRIQADELDMVETPKPDGTSARKVVARGNVVFLKGEERLAGERMELDLDSGRGTFENAVGYTTAGVMFEAKKIERVDADTYRLEGARFTACYQPQPRWAFSAGSARLEVDDKVIAKNVVFRVKGVPALYLPILAYPIEEDQRSTGFLFPSFGYSSFRGFTIGEGFFWAMARNADQTLMVENYSKFGLGIGHELRYLLGGASRGIFRTQAVRPSGTTEWDWDLDYNAIQMLPHRGRANLQVRQYSNLLLMQQFQDTLNLFSRRTRRSSLTISEPIFKTLNAQIWADSLDTFFPGEEGTQEQRTNRHMPSLRLTRSPQKLGHTGMALAFDGRAERLGLGNGVADPSFLGLGVPVEYLSRYDVWPRLSRPFSLSFLQVSPEVQFRYTRWSSSVCPDGEECAEDLIYPGGPLDRRYVEGRVDLQGPNFFHVFERAPGSFYSERFKHVIGPEVTYTYRTRVDDFDVIPKFDGDDYVLGTNEVRYSLVNRLYAKRPGRGGKLEAWEFINWRVSQTYYVQISENQNSFDPNYSTSFYGPGGVPSHISPILSSFRVRPTRDTTGFFDFEYDANFQQTRRISMGTVVRTPRVDLVANWSRLYRVAQKVENQVVTADTVRGQAKVDVVPGSLTLWGNADWDILNKNQLQYGGVLSWGIQCCAFSVDVTHSDYNEKQGLQFGFSIELAGIGSMGSFQGPQAQDSRRQFGGGMF